MAQFKKHLAAFSLKFSDANWAILAWLGLLAIACYGILIPTLGFYWDDLPYLYQYAAQGTGGFPAYVAPDRPFSAWIFMITTALFGFNPIGYHILALILRWLSAVLIFKIFISLWPRERIPAIMTASASILYPGFTQQPIALIYNHHFSVFTAFLLSLYLMILAEKKQTKKPFYRILSLIFTLGMFSIENFSTLEAIRPFILYKINNEKDQSVAQKEKITRVVKSWLPYLMIFCVFLIWRVFIFSFPTYKPEFLTHFRNSPLQAMISLLSRIPHDFYIVYAGAWVETISFPIISDFGRMATILNWGIISSILAICIFMFFSSNINKKPKIKNNNSSFKHSIEMLSGSIILFFAAGGLIWVLDLPVVLEFSNNRLLLAFIPAAALLIGSISAMFSHQTRIVTLVICVLFALASGSHFQNGMAYKRDWENLQVFLTQLSWRVPALDENTIFITSETGLKFYSDSSLTSPVNLMYTDDIKSLSYPHLVYATYSPRSVDWFAQDIHNADYQRIDRSFTFSGNSAHVLSYLYRPPGCLQILDDTYSNSVAISNLTDLQVKEIPFSNLGLIAQEPQKEPYSPLFTKNITLDWCYYFEKADLARQYQDFEAIAEFGNSAIGKGMEPRVASEWLPFLEGYLWNGDWKRVDYVIEQINRAESNYKSGMCYTMSRIKENKMYPFPDQLSALFIEQQCR